MTKIRLYDNDRKTSEDACSINIGKGFPKNNDTSYYITEYKHPLLWSESAMNMALSKGPVKYNLNLDMHVGYYMVLCNITEYFLKPNQ